MILLHLPAPQWNARFVKIFHGQARDVTHSGFDEYFFESEPEGTCPMIPKSFEGIDLLGFLDAYSNDRDDVEYLACMCIKNKLDPVIVGLIAERHPSIARWLVDMMQRQRKLISDFLSQHDIPDFPTVTPPDSYTPYIGACLAALSRIKARGILGDLESE